VGEWAVGRLGGESWLWKMQVQRQLLVLFFGLVRQTIGYACSVVPYCSDSAKKMRSLFFAIPG